MSAEAPFSSFSPEMTRLRRRIAQLERGRRTAIEAMPLGLAALDEALPEGGLARGAVHEIIPADPGEGSAFGFAAHLLGRLQRQEAGKWVLWCGRSERLYAPGLRLCGLDPARLATVRTAHDGDGLWVLEEALRCRDLAGAVVEIENLTLAQSRRLQLAAEGGGTGLLLRTGERAAGASAAATRWRIGALPGAPGPADGLPGRPRWRLELMRCRGGRPGRWIVEGVDDATGGFALAAALRDGPAEPQTVRLVG